MGGCLGLQARKHKAAAQEALSAHAELDADARAALEAALAKHAREAARASAAEAQVTADPPL